MFEFKLPDLGEGIHEAEIVKWHVSVGDRIEEDAPLIDVETDKATATIPSPKAGRVDSLSGDVGDVLTVGQVIAVLGDGKGEPPPKEAETPVSAKAPAAERRAAVAPETTKQRMDRPVPAAPAIRRLAREMGIDLRQVRPSGPAGRVMADDVKRFAEGAPSEAPVERPPSLAAPPSEERPAETELAAQVASAIPFLDIEPLPDFGQWGPVDTEPLRSIRRRVAHKMVTSMILVPHVAHMDEADVTVLEEFRHAQQEHHKEKPGKHLTLLSFVVKAVTGGLKAAPVFNASLDPFKETIIYKKYYNIGIAVDTGRGLVVPVIRNTDRRSIMEIAREIEELSDRARESKITVDELRGGTFTITNVGPLGGTALIPTINYPEVAILGMGRIQEKPVVREGRIVIRKMLPLTLAFDHRVADGADAARFVAELVRHLSDPNLLLLET